MYSVNYFLIYILFQLFNILSFASTRAIRESSCIVIVNTVGDPLPLSVSSDGQLQNTDTSDNIYFIKLPSSSAERISIGQTIDSDDYVIAVSPDGSVSLEVSDDLAEGSGNSLEVLFSVDPHHETHLKMDLRGQDQCLSFKDNRPIMTECSGADKYEIVSC